MIKKRSPLESTAISQQEFDGEELVNVEEDDTEDDRLSGAGRDF